MSHFKKNLSIIFVAMIVSINSMSQDISRNDLTIMIDDLTKQGSCGIGSKNSYISDDLIIKMIGHELIGSQIPRAKNKNQNDFYSLAILSNTIPTREDKELLLRLFYGDNCLNLNIQYEDEEIRKMMIEGHQAKANARRALEMDQLTYEQIYRTLSIGINKDLVERFEISLEKNPDLKQRMTSAMMPLTQRIQVIFKKYNLN